MLMKHGYFINNNYQKLCKLMALLVCLWKNVLSSPVLTDMRFECMHVKDATFRLVLLPVCMMDCGIYIFSAHGILME